MRIYEIGRKILHHHHQLLFAKEVPEPSVHKISLSIQSQHDIGFQMSGGSEKGLPIYCSRILKRPNVRKSTVNPTRIPLQTGDQILRINTISLSQCTLEEAKDILRQQARLSEGNGNKITLTGKEFT